MNMIKKLPLTSEPNRQLSYLPEFIMENIIDPKEVHGVVCTANASVGTNWLEMEELS